MTTFLEGILIIIKASLCTWGAYSIIAKGLRCLVESMIQKSSPRRIADIEVIIDTLALIGFAVFPTAMAAAVPAIVPEGSCNPQFNVHRFLPLRTRDDIKGILESWVGLLMVHGRTGMSLQQFGKWRLTLARVAVWSVSLVGWVTVEVYMGPCWYLPRVWKFWFSIICISLMSWFLGNAESLIVTKWELLGKVHVQLALYLWVLYFVRWVNLDGYCVRPTCW
ncbi:uncharacterized protein CTRU02_214472 [Colletotrichum truncatum]|uniref:Uncharacterized protein n=1 Tax=Colletotrichum truncatum TaxID=5467 RepID=A0ACC3YEV5_COLTU